jgi:hypothetical protein
MSNSWKSSLRTDPLPALYAWSDPGLVYFVQRVLLKEPVGPIEALCNLPDACRLVNKLPPPKAAALAMRLKGALVL